MRSDGAVSHSQNSPLASLSRDFSPLAVEPRNVRLQTESDEAQSMGLKAFTRGSEVHFAPGEYRPETTAGQEIIAHEYVHVRQQALGRASGGGFADAGTLEHQAQVQSPILSAAPFGMLQGFSEENGGGDGGFKRYRFQARHFWSKGDPLKAVFQSWYMGGSSQGYVVPYNDVDQVAAKMALQQALNQINSHPKYKSSELYLEPDGQFGANTTAAIRAFQKSQGLTPDGTIGPATFRRIDEILAYVELARGGSIETRYDNYSKYSYSIFSPNSSTYDKDHDEIIAMIDRNKVVGGVGWGGQNTARDFGEVTGYLHRLKLLEFRVDEEQDALIHYRCHQLQLDSETAQVETPATDKDSESTLMHKNLHAAPRIDVSKTPKTVQAILMFQKRYGFPATGRIVKGTKEWDFLKAMSDKKWQENMEEWERIEKAKPPREDGSGYADE